MFLKFLGIVLYFPLLCVSVLGMSRIELFFILCWSNISLFSGKPTQPNIVIIMADDLGFNDVSWHNAVVKTPHLESLARNGVLLEQHYSQPLCTPTRASLLTGR